ALKKSGATLVDPADIETLGKFCDSELLVFLYELKADLNAYLARLGPGAPVRTLKDIIDFNERNRQKEMPYFGQDTFKLDAIGAPTGGPAWLTDLVNGDAFSGGSSNAAAVAGYPNINVTAGFISGLPVGISFFGRAWSEPTLIRLTFAFEQTVKARHAPRFFSTVGAG